ncbi:MAG: hypothetical protein BWK76_02540 [Desulfobulbaceae bacterium A2]|nr:MAG: hypothetical protein BWK76_02540 [Desulfobulbaceae bacterium A2]
MGGFGSGRQLLGNGHGLTSAHRSLDVRQVHREKLLVPGLSYGWGWYVEGVEQASIAIRTASDKLTLSYRHKHLDGEWHPMEYPVRLTWTDCALGGRRPWFICPAVGCGRRVAKLYLGHSGVFACRHCYRLAYPSQRETIEDRAGRRINTIRRRLGWEPGFLNPNGDKPKGMHWRTFERLEQQHDFQMNRYLLSLDATLLKMLGRQNLLLP